MADDDIKLVCATGLAQGAGHGALDSSAVAHRDLFDAPDHLA